MTNFTPYTYKLIQPRQMSKTRVFGKTGLQNDKKYSKNEPKMTVNIEKTDEFDKINGLRKLTLLRIIPYTAV